MSLADIRPQDLPQYVSVGGLQRGITRRMRRRDNTNQELVKTISSHIEKYLYLDAFHPEDQQTIRSLNEPGQSWPRPENRIYVWKVTFQRRERYFITDQGQLGM